MGHADVIESLEREAPADDDGRQISLLEGSSRDKRRKK